MERRVLVVDGDNRPVAGALVAIQGSDTPMPDIAFETDAEGAITADLPEGNVSITAHDGKRHGISRAGAGQETIVVILR